MDFLPKTIEFLTDPNGIGFPLLIGAGLGVILYLMHFTTKEQKAADEEIEEKKDRFKGPNLPYEPF
ncbi:MAG: hypothetical protein WC505_07845 [Patescibacteria group bacterium]